MGGGGIGLGLNLLKSQSPYCGGRGGGGLGTNFPVLMQGPNMLKSKNIFSRGFAENFLSFCHDFIRFRVPKVNTKWSLETYVYVGP